MNYVVPVAIFLTLLFAVIKKASVYDSFIVGIRESLSLVVSLLPYLSSIFMLMEIFRASGLSEKISSILAVPLSYLGIPKELCELLILRPLSGSGSLAVVENIFNQYGVDSYVSRCASVIMASNDTIFYIAAVYLSTSKDKRCGQAVAISLVCSFFGAIVACFLCKIF